MSSLFKRMRAALNLSPYAVSHVAPLFNVIGETDTSPAEITLYGDVLESDPVDFWTGEPEPGNHITIDGVLEELERVRDAKEIVIHLNSSGGDLFAGITIYNRIKSFLGHKTVIVDGLAASAASVIMCAADTVKVYPGSMVMIHNVASFLYGYYSTPELREMLNAAEAAETSIKRIYAEKTGKTESELQALLDATMWYVGTDAIDEGFADALMGDDAEGELDAKVTNDGRYLMVAGIPHLVAHLGALPPWLTNQSFVLPVANATCGYRPDTGGNDAATTGKECGMDITNAADLRSAYPELVAAVEADAAASERERIRSIQEISNSIRNEELIFRAMFEEPMSAKDVALCALRAEAKTASQVLADMDADAKAAADGNVAPAPSEDETEDDDEEKEKETVNALVDLYRNQLKGRR